MKLVSVFSGTILFFFIVSCKKEQKQIQHIYPEDPGTTTLTPRERLDASWKIYSYHFKGKEIIQYLDTIQNGKVRIEDVSLYYSYREDYRKWLFHVFYGNHFNLISENYFKIDEPYYITFYGGSKTLFSKWFMSPFLYVPANDTLKVKWTITKLYDKDLNLVLHTDSGDYKMFLRKEEQ